VKNKSYRRENMKKAKSAKKGKKLGAKKLEAAKPLVRRA
jgi:hypothetical protein